MNVTSRYNEDPHGTRQPPAAPPRAHRLATRCSRYARPCSTRTPLRAQAIARSPPRAGAAAAPGPCRPAAAPAPRLAAQGLGLGRLGLRLLLWRLAALALLLPPRRPGGCAQGAPSAPHAAMRPPDAPPAPRGGRAARTPRAAAHASTTLHTHAHTATARGRDARGRCARGRGAGAGPRVRRGAPWTKAPPGPVTSTALDLPPLSEMVYSTSSSSFKLRKPSLATQRAVSAGEGDGERGRGGGARCGAGGGAGRVRTRGSRSGGRRCRPSRRWG
jgi:hypothetical protein